MIDIPILKEEYKPVTFDLQLCEKGKPPVTLCRYGPNLEIDRSDIHEVPIPDTIRDKILDALKKDLDEHPMPLRCFTPANPPRKDWLSKLPIAVPIKPEFIKLNIDTRDPFEINNRTLEELIEENHYTMPLQIITSKEKTVMQAKAIFDLYFKRAYEALDKAAEDKLNQLVEEDENTKRIKETFEQLNNSLTDTPRDFVGFHLFRGPSYNQLTHCTGDTRKKVELWSEKEVAEREHLDRMREEVEAQLLACETYEQARAILRTYSIISFDGDLEYYKPF